MAAALHYAAGYAFPRPWPDESHFIAPALSLVRDGALAVPQLNAPHGIFWMPAGYYVVQAPLLLLGADPLTAGRTLSLAGIVVFAVTAALVAQRAGGEWWPATIAVVAWLCFPRVVAIGNVARMEALVLAIAALCVWLIQRNRWPVAVAMSLLAPLLHPVGVVVSVAVVGARLVRRGRRWTTKERALLAAVALLWLAQVLYLAAHADLVADHLGFQLARKADRAVAPAWWQLVALVSAGIAGIVVTFRRRGDGRDSESRLADAGLNRQLAWVVVALAGGFVVVDILGREMWYQPLGRETFALLVVLLVVVTVPRLRPDRRHVATSAVVAVAALGAVAGVYSTANRTWYGMRTAAVSHAQWHAFTAAGIDQLRQLDRSAGPPRTVLVDPFSGFGQEVFAHEWQRLRFVQPTPATADPMPEADYLLTTPGAPFVTRRLVAQWGDPDLELASPGRRYRLLLFSSDEP